MTTPLICLFLAMLLPYVARVPVAIGMGKAQGGYDNNTPRLQQLKLEGLPQRALGAHKNSFEALLIFASALFIASQGEVDATRLNQLCMVFVGARVAYILTYLADMAIGRSVFWFVGFGVSLWIAVL